MAKAVRGNPDKRAVTLTLSNEEAQVLATILCNVGGTPDLGNPRFHADNVRIALQNIGLNGFRHPDNPYEADGAVFIENKEKSSW